MKIIVCVKQVPDTSGKVAVNPDGTLNRASMAAITNPDDLNAGLLLQDQGRSDCRLHGPPARRGYAPRGYGPGRGPRHSGVRP